MSVFFEVKDISEKYYMNFKLNNLITGIKYYSEMKRLINFLIINTMIGIGHISSNDKCHDLVLLNNQCLLTLPGAGETTSPLHV